MKTFTLVLILLGSNAFAQGRCEALASLAGTATELQMEGLPLDVALETLSVYNGTGLEKGMEATYRLVYDAPAPTPHTLQSVQNMNRDLVLFYCEQGTNGFEQ